MKKPLITIAIAIYNTERYIQEALLSVINQTYENIEILCIDDGSIDNSQMIVSKLIKKDPRIKLAELPINQGLSAIRNLALEMAKGEYILFMDGDDVINEALIEKAVNLAIKEKSDLIIWDYAIDYNKLDTNSERKHSFFLRKNVKNNAELLQLPSFIWTKLIKTDIAKKIKLHFPEKLTKQDIPVHWKLILEIENISFINRKLIYYRQHKNSISYTNNQSFFDVFKIMNITEDYLRKNNFYPVYKEIFIKQKFNLFFNIYNTIEETYAELVKKEIKKNLSNDELLYIDEIASESFRQFIFFKSLSNDNFVYVIINKTLELLRQIKHKIIR